VSHHQSERLKLELLLLFARGCSMQQPPVPKDHVADDVGQGEDVGPGLSVRSPPPGSPPVAPRSPLALVTHAVAQTSIASPSSESSTSSSVSSSSSSTSSASMASGPSPSPLPPQQRRPTRRISAVETPFNDTPGAYKRLRVHETGSTTWVSALLRVCADNPG
jgi:hypothetical protein